jgi:hypothetical protein
MYNYPIVCRHTGEVLKEFPFPHLRDQYIHDHKLHNVAWLRGVTELCLSWGTYDELEHQYYITEARLRYC